MDPIVKELIDVVKISKEIATRSASHFSIRLPNGPNYVAKLSEKQCGLSLLKGLQSIDSTVEPFEGKHNFYRSANP